MVEITTSINGCRSPSSSPEALPEEDNAVEEEEEEEEEPMYLPSTLPRTSRLKPSLDADDGGVKYLRGKDIHPCFTSRFTLWFGVAISLAKVIMFGRPEN